MKFSDYCRRKVIHLIEDFRKTRKLRPSLLAEGRQLGFLEGKVADRNAAKARKMASEQNHLMPVESVFQRDNPLVGAWGRSNPDNFAYTCIFVVITPLTSLWEVWKTFPIIKAMLEHRWTGGEFDTKERTDKPVLDYKMLKGSLAGNQPKEPDPKGYGMGAAMTDTKWRAVAAIWSKRKAVFSHVSKFMSPSNPDPVMLVDGLLTSQLPGMDVVKASFVTQMLMGKLGCIDVHNHNIYRSYFLHSKSPEEAEKKIGILDPWQPAYSMTDAERKSLTPKSQAKRFQKIENYMGALRMLEDEGFTTGALWDIWCNYVAHYWPDMYNPEMGPGVSEELAHMKKVSTMRVNYLLSGQEHAHLRPTYGLADFDDGGSYDQANARGVGATPFVGLEKWIKVYRKGNPKVATTIYRDERWKKTLDAWLEKQDLSMDDITIDPPNPDKMSDSDPDFSRQTPLATFDPRYRIRNPDGSAPNSLAWDTQQDAAAWVRSQLDAAAYYWDDAAGVVRKAKATASDGTPIRSDKDAKIGSAPKTKEEALKWIQDKKRGLDQVRTVQGGWSPSQEAGHLIIPGQAHPGSRAVGMAHRLDLMNPADMARRQLELGRRLGGRWDKEKEPRTDARDYHRALSQGSEAKRARRQ